jgi:hypothetical protein
MHFQNSLSKGQTAALFAVFIPMAIPNVIAVDL